MEFALPKSKKNQNKPKNKYQTFYQLWKKNHPHQKGFQVQNEVNDFWRENRNDTLKIDAAIRSLKHGKFDNGGFVEPASSISTTEPQVASENQSTELSRDPDQEMPVLGVPAAATPKRRSKSKPVRVKREPEDAEGDLSSERRETPAQRRICLQLSESNLKIEILQKSIKESNIPDEQQFELLQELQQESFELKRQLKRLKDCATRNRRCRERKKMKTEMTKSLTVPSGAAKVAAAVATTIAATNTNTTTAAVKKDRSSRSRGSKSRVSVRGPMWQLLQTIVDVVSQLTVVEEKRMQALRACRTLDELHLELKLHGFQINRMAPFIRILPMYWSTYDGKRHKKTVPVVVRRSLTRQADDDHHFILATVTFLRDLAELFGPLVCFVLSHDSKVRVPIGQSAADDSAPLLMRLDYRSDDDGDNPTGSHQLLPSVYAGISFDSTGNLNPAGPTYVAVHSGRHDRLTAESHVRHFRRVVKSEAFRTLSLDRGGGELKPVVIAFVDDGPATCPALPDTLRHAAALFQDHDLDALFVAVHGRSETLCGAIEQRLAALSADVAGIVLPRDYCGSHLDADCDTTRPQLERTSFRRAGECLAAVWSESELDGYAVDARYVEPPLPDATTDRVEDLSENWKAEHVRQSQYLLQIVKCGSPACCKPFRTNLHCYLPRGFLPPPLLVRRTERGVILCNKSRTSAAADCGGFFADLFQRLTLQHLEPDMLPFDYFCPSVASRLAERTCDTCRLYLPTRAACRRHQDVHKQVIQKYVYSIREKLHQFVEDVAPPSSSPEASEDECGDSDRRDDCVCGERDSIYVLPDMRSWLEPVFQEITH